MPGYEASRSWGGKRLLLPAGTERNAPQAGIRPCYSHFQAQTNALLQSPLQQVPRGPSETTEQRCRDKGLVLQKKKSNPGVRLSCPYAMIPPYPWASRLARIPNGAKTFRRVIFNPESRPIPYPASGRLSTCQETKHSRKCFPAFSSTVTYPTSHSMRSCAMRETRRVSQHSRGRCEQAAVTSRWPTYTGIKGHLAKARSRVQS